MHPLHPITFDLIALGEAVVDLISEQISESLAYTTHFRRHAGGQVANLAMNLARLGKRTAAAVCLGEDGFGDFLLQELRNAGVETQFVQRTSQAPTTTVIVSRQTQTPDFLIFRGADSCLQPDEALFSQITHSRLVHTSAFALARQPARTTILDALQTARQRGVTVSLDPNYHPSVWPDISDFRHAFLQFLALADMTKPSLEDCQRLIGADMTPEAYAQRFLELGVKTVVITMGPKGVLLGTNHSDPVHIPASAVEVSDITGAGDAFWSGFLTGWLEGRSPLEAACLGQVVAEVKIGQIGPMLRLPDRETLIRRALRLKRKVLSARGGDFIG